MPADDRPGCIRDVSIDVTGFTPVTAPRPCS